MINEENAKNQEINLDDLFDDDSQDTQQIEDDKIFNELMDMFDN